MKKTSAELELLSDSLVNKVKCTYPDAVLLSLNLPMIT